jgi:hypothetical protein
MLRPRRPYSNAKVDLVPETVFDRGRSNNNPLAADPENENDHVRAYCSAGLLKFSLRFKLQLKRHTTRGVLK